MSLTVQPGELVALMGPSGSGKSTLLHVVGGIESADSGSVLVDGVDLVRLSRRRLAVHRRQVGFVFQRFNLLPALTVLDNVIAPVLPFHVDFDKAERARELLSAVGMADRAGSMPAKLSGGQQQRVAIARALIAQPRLILADEPTGNLDSVSGGEVMRLLVDVCASGVTVLIATHDPTIAGECDRVVALRDGQLVADERRASRSVERETVYPEPRPDTSEARGATAGWLPRRMA